MLIHCMQKEADVVKTCSDCSRNAQERKMRGEKKSLLFRFVLNRILAFLSPGEILNPLLKRTGHAGPGSSSVLQTKGTY